MTNKTGINRRNVIKLGTLGGLAMVGGAAPLMQVGFAAEGHAMPINIVTSNSTLTHTLLHVLDAKGYMKEFGVKQTFMHLADNSKVIPALLGGQADMSILLGFSTVLAAIEKGAGVKILGGAGLLPQYAVYTKNPKIKTVKDLEGHTIGTGAVGALLYQLMVALLEKHGVNPKKVTFRDIGSNTAVFRAVVAGTIDAGPSGLNVYDEQKKYGVHVIEGGNLWEDLPDYTYQGAYASDRAIKDKRDALVRTLAAFAKMFRYIETPHSKETFLQSYQKATGKKNTKAALTEWNFIQKTHPYASNLVLSKKRLDYMQKLNVQFGMQKKVMPFDRVANMSLARDAIKLIGGHA